MLMLFMMDVRKKKNSQSAWQQVECWVSIVCAEGDESKISLQVTVAFFLCQVHFWTFCFNTSYVSVILIHVKPF